MDLHTGAGPLSGFLQWEPLRESQHMVGRTVRKSVYERKKKIKIW